MEQKRIWLAQRSGPAIGWVGQLQARLSCDTYDRLGDITVPTLITASDQDLIVGTHHAREMHVRIPGSRLEILQGTGATSLSSSGLAQPRLAAPDPPRTAPRRVRSVTTAPGGFEGEGFPLHRASSAGRSPEYPVCR